MTSSLGFEVLVKFHFNGNNRALGVRRAQFEVQKTGHDRVACIMFWTAFKYLNSFHYGCNKPQPQLGFNSINLGALYYKVEHAININPPRTYTKYDI